MAVHEPCTRALPALAVAFALGLGGCTPRLPLAPASLHAAADDYRERALQMLHESQDLFDVLEVDMRGHVAMLTGCVEQALSGAAA